MIGTASGSSCGRGTQNDSTADWASTSMEVTSTTWDGWLSESVINTADMYNQSLLSLKHEKFSWTKSSIYNLNQELQFSCR